MIKFLRALFKEDSQPEEKTHNGLFSTDIKLSGSNTSRQQRMSEAMKKSLQKTAADMTILNPDGTALAMDSQEHIALKQGFNFTSNIPEASALWFASQGFIGFQMAAILSQNWLIDKACQIPAKDAVRNGWEITVNDGTEVDASILDKLKEFDRERKITKQMVEFVHMGRVFGIRIALFLVETDDPKEYYGNPFNVDAVKPGSYKGISQIDPYWITPELDLAASSDPMSMGFYEPTWWRVNGLRIHKSHLVIFKTGNVPDILKPSYLYAGVPVPQKIFERVYAAERTANEAPMLAMTKRLNIIKVDAERAVANQAAFEAQLQQSIEWRDNYGVKVIGLDEEMQQLDTSLADLDSVIMTQYQIVAAAANIPSTKLLGTSPKGFNASGEYEESSYHEELENIQSHDLTPFLDRHHLLAIHSFISPDAPFKTTVSWNSLDSMTAKELAEVNKLKADIGNVLVTSGAISPDDERERVMADPESGYNGLVSVAELPEDDLSE
jgi:hypothetical protein